MFNSATDLSFNVQSVLEYLPWSSWSVWSVCGPMTSKCTRTRHCPYGSNDPGKCLLVGVVNMWSDAVLTALTTLVSAWSVWSVCGPITSKCTRTRIVLTAPTTLVSTYSWLVWSICGPMTSNCISEHDKCCPYGSNDPSKSLVNMWSDDFQVYPITTFRNN